MKKRLASVLVMSLLVLTSVLPFTAAFVADSSEQGIVNDEQAAVTEQQETTVEEQTAIANEVNSDMERLSQAEVQLNAISAQSGDLGEFVKVVQTITKIAKQLKDLLGSNGTLIDPNTLAVIHSKVDLLEACVDATSVGANDMVYKTKPARVALAMAITRASLTLGDPWVTVDEVKAATTRLQNAVATAVASRDITDNDIAAVPFRHHLCNSIHDANQACSTYLKDTKNPKIKAIRKQLRRAIHKANRVKGDHFSTVADVNKAIADLNKAVDDAIAAAQAV